MSRNFTVENIPICHFLQTQFYSWTFDLKIFSRLSPEKRRRKKTKQKTCIIHFVLLKTTSPGSWHNNEFIYTDRLLMCRSNWILMTYHPFHRFFFHKNFFFSSLVFGLGASARNERVSIHSLNVYILMLSRCNVQNTSEFSLIEIQWMPPNSTLMTRILHFVQSKDLSLFSHSANISAQQILYFYLNWKHAYEEHCFCHQLKIPLHLFLKEKNSNFFPLLTTDELLRCSLIFIFIVWILVKWTECLFEIMNNHFWQIALTIWINIKISWNRPYINIVCGTKPQGKQLTNVFISIFQPVRNAF